MKKIPGFTFILFLATACTGDPSKNTAAAQGPPPEELTAAYKIDFEKNISTSHDAGGTLTIKRSGNLLFLHDSHVSSESLSCIDYASGKELWKIPHAVESFFLYDGKLLVQFEDHLELLEMNTGRAAWKADSTYIRYFYGELEPGDIVPVTHKEKTALFDLRQHSIILYSDSIVQATLFSTDRQGHIVRRFTALDKKQRVPGKLLQTAIVEDENGNRQNFFWSLEDKKRLFTLSVFNDTAKINTLTWTMPKSQYSDTVPRYRSNGEPEPEVLSATTAFIKGKLYLFENYVNYRWSWGQGCNRLTCIALPAQHIAYQVWGKAPGTADFNTFHFMDDAVIRSERVLHFQSPAGRNSPMDLSSGKTRDSLAGNFNQFMSFRPNLLLGFNFHSTQQGEKYRHGVAVSVVNHASGKQSERFDFDFGTAYPYEAFLFPDGLLIFYNYNEKNGKNDLYCYRVKALE